MSEIAQFARLKQQWIEVAPGPIEGCTEEDLQLLMKKQRVNFLPEAYRQFMMSFGKQAGGLQTYEGEFRFPQALDFKDNYGKSLPSHDCFVFLYGPDDFGRYFQTKNLQHDPVTYIIRETRLDESPNLLETVICCYLSEWLNEWLKIQISALKK